MGVKYALEGHSGYMVSLLRESDSPYSCTTGLAPLDKVANFAKEIPEGYINAEGNDVTQKFLDYVTPLLGEEMPTYPRFEGHLAAKLLDAYTR
jgi:6-phosphofructokinase 1